MIYVSIFAFALALGAVVFVALVSITLWRLRRELDSRVATMRSNLHALSARLNAKIATPVTLEAKVAELNDAVARLARTQQRFAGRFYATTRSNGVDQAHEPTDVSEADPEIAELLRLQSAPPAKPQ